MTLLPTYLPVFPFISFLTNLEFRVPKAFINWLDKKEDVKQRARQCRRYLRALCSAHTTLCPIVNFASPSIFIASVLLCILWQIGGSKSSLAERCDLPELRRPGTNSFSSDRRNSNPKYFLHNRTNDGKGVNNLGINFAIKTLRNVKHF